MALYRNTETGQLHQTVDGSRQDRRLSESSLHVREGGGDEGRSLAARSEHPIPPPPTDSADTADEPDGDDA